MKEKINIIKWIINKKQYEEELRKIDSLEKEITTYQQQLTLYKNKNNNLNAKLGDALLFKKRYFKLLNKIRKEKKLNDKAKCKKENWKNV